MNKVEAHEIVTIKTSAIDFDKELQYTDWQILESRKHGVVFERLQDLRSVGKIPERKEHIIEEFL